MTEQFVVSSSAPRKALENAPATGTLLLSSEGIGWEELSVRVYQEPVELEGWIDPTGPDISLVLVTHGAIHLEQRHANGPWKRLRIRQGDLFLTPGGSPSYELRWKSFSSEPLQTLRLLLNTELLSRTAQEVAGRDHTRLALIKHSGFQDPLLTQIGLALGRELEQRSPAGKLYAQTAAQMLAVHLLRHYSFEKGTFQDAAHGLTQQQIRRVIDFIQAHLGQDLSLEILAQQVGFSPYHFARLFRQTTGDSPHQFILRQRLERAQQLLKETNVPLVSVALESGFANQSHLTQAFQRYLGLTPRAYRQTHASSADF